MARPFFIRCISLLPLLIPNIFVHSAPISNGDPTQRALDSLTVLQQWYNATGLWDTTGWWNGANIMTMIGDLAKADSENVKLQVFAANLFAKTAKVAPAKNPQPGIEADGRQALHITGSKPDYNKTLDPFTFLPRSSYPANWFVFDNPPRDLAQASVSNLPDDAVLEVAPSTLDPNDWLDGYYDDDLWWGLAWVRAYDVTQHGPYLTLASGIFSAVSKVWPTHCSGGIYWSSEKNYVNAIANELFFSTAAHLANRVDPSKKQYYLDWAEQSIGWILDQDWFNKDGNINDGLNDECENNNGTVWSYNQGVILGGLVELYRATPDDFVYGLVQYYARIGVRALSDSNGVIHDPCEETDCGLDGTQFKGIFMRNLGMVYKLTREEMFAQAIRINAESIWQNDRDENGVFSVNWAGPFVRPGNASTHSSAMDALVAAVVVGK